MPCASRPRVGALVWGGTEAQAQAQVQAGAGVPGPRAQGPAPRPRAQGLGHPDPADGLARPEPGSSLQQLEELGRARAVHRGAHVLSARSTESYEGARDKVARVIGAGDRRVLHALLPSRPALATIARSNQGAFTPLRWTMEIEDALLEMLDEVYGKQPRMLATPCPPTTRAPSSAFHAMWADFVGTIAGAVKITVLTRTKKQKP